MVRDLDEALPEGKPCPSCQASLDSDAVLCIHCGFDLRTGMKHPTVASARVPPLDGDSSTSKPPRKPKKRGPKSRRREAPDDEITGRRDDTRQWPAILTGSIIGLLASLLIAVAVCCFFLIVGAALASTSKQGGGAAAVKSGVAIAVLDMPIGGLAGLISGALAGWASQWSGILFRVLTSVVGAAIGLVVGIVGLLVAHALFGVVVRDGLTQFFGVLLCMMMAGVAARSARKWTRVIIHRETEDW